MAIVGQGGSIINGLGPINQPLNLPVNTKPALASGVFNNTVGAAGVEVLSASANGMKRRVKVTNPLAGRNIAWTTVRRGSGVTPTTMTAVGDGSATDGSLIMGGGGISEWIQLADDEALWLTASAAATPYQLTVVEYQ